MDNETKTEIKHCENARLNQDIRLGEHAKDLIKLKDRVTVLEYMLYELKKQRES